MKRANVYVYVCSYNVRKYNFLFFVFNSEIMQSPFLFLLYAIGDNVQLHLCLTFEY